MSRRDENKNSVAGYEAGSDRKEAAVKDLLGKIVIEQSNESLNLLLKDLQDNCKEVKARARIFNEFVKEYFQDYNYGSGKTDDELVKNKPYKWSQDAGTYVRDGERSVISEYFDPTTTENRKKELNDTIEQLPDENRDIKQKFYNLKFARNVMGIGKAVVEKRAINGSVEEKQPGTSVASSGSAQRLGGDKNSSVGIIS